MDDYDSELDYESFNTSLLIKPLPMPFERIMMSVKMIISLLILFSNSLVLIAIFKFKRLRTITNVYIVNLSCADLFLGIFSLMYTTMVIVDVHIPGTGIVRCLTNLMYVAMIFLTTTSGFFLLSISIDRFIAICMPYRYPRLMTKSKTAIICSFIWIYSLLWVVFPYFGHHHWVDMVSCSIHNTTVSQVYSVMFVLHTLITILILSILYLKMYCIAASKSVETQLLKLVVIRSESSASHDKCSVDSKQLTKGRQYGTFTFTRNLKATKTVALVVGIYSVCVIPFVIIIILDISQVDGLWIDYSRIIMMFFLTLNSAINPLIYHLRNSEFRNAFKKIVHYNNGSERSVETSVRD